MQLPSLRRWGFWTLDRLRGGRVAWHCRDIEALLWDPSEAQRVQSERLQELLETAVTHVAYWRGFQGARSLAEFPILQKRTIREHYDEFISDAWDRDTLVPRSTSGSYGTPLTFLLTPDKRRRQHAEIITFGAWSGFHVGDRYALTRSRPELKPRLALAFQNETPIVLDAIDMGWLERCRIQLKRAGVRCIVGYPSVIGTLAQYCQARGDTACDFAVGSVICTGEALTHQVREAVARAFGCVPLGRYTTNELGVIAHECSEALCYHVNIGTYLVELIAVDGDRPAAPGEPGRVIVTDLFSHAMPLIRYETGDIAIAGTDCSCGCPAPVLSNILGRSCEAVTTTDGRAVPPIVVGDAMRDLNGILQFQCVQRGHGDYVLRLFALPSFSQEGLAVERLIEVLGTDANIQVEYVDEIPPLPSGKRPYTINESVQHRAGSDDAPQPSEPPHPIGADGQ